MSLLAFLKKIFPCCKTSCACQPRSKVTAPSQKTGQRSKEKQIGVVTHYYGNLSVAIIRLSNPLKVGDRIHIKGAHDDFSQKVDSMQVNHQDIQEAAAGDEIGIKVIRQAHENDKVYLL